MIIKTLCQCVWVCGPGRSLWALPCDCRCTTQCVWVLTRSSSQHTVSNAPNYGLLLAPVILSFPRRFKADMEVGWGWRASDRQCFPRNMFLFIHNEAWLSAGLHAPFPLSLAAAPAVTATMACSKEKYVLCLHVTANTHTATRWILCLAVGLTLYKI